MRIAALSMVKNEVGIIADFVAHAGALCDLVVIADHQSTDGTAAFLSDLEAADERFVLYRYDEAPYEQALLLNTLLHAAPEFEDVDWVLMLDADEFVAVEDRSELEAALADAADARALKLPWKNLIPSSFGEGVVVDQPFWHPRGTSKFSGLAVNMNANRGTSFAVNQGSTALQVDRDSWSIDAPLGPALLHLPIRNNVQIARKLVQGNLAYAQRMDGSTSTAGAHWRKLQELFSEDGSVDEDMLRGAIHTYGLDEPVQRISTEDLEQAGYVEKAFAPVSMDLPIARPEAQSVAQVLFSVGTSPVDAGKVPIRALQIDEGRSIVRSQTDPGVRFEPLVGATAADPIDPDGTLTDDEYVMRFMLPSAWPVKTIVPSAWNGHIPLMFCLVNLLRPRRYAELGSHYGASFFASCQAAERLETGGEKVAIDLWQGDEHAGFYGDEVIDRFRKTLAANEYDRAYYLRKLFEDAVHEFADHSLDMLLIDGLHTYEAVKGDMDTWIDKVVPGGLILFHDTNVHEREFGVWQLWDEISEARPSFNFMHTHGLGLWQTPGDGFPHVGRLLNHLDGDGAAGAFVEAMFESAGERAEASARLNDLISYNGGNVANLYRLGRAGQNLSTTRLELKDLRREAERRAEKIGRQNERIASLRRRLDGAQANLETLRAEAAQAAEAQNAAAAHAAAPAPTPPSQLRRIAGAARRAVRR